MASELWLLRHAEAAAHGSTASDADRPLTERGELQSRVAGTALRTLGVSFAAVYTSPKLRAQQTATLACEALGGVEPTAHEPLAEGFSASDALALARTVDGGRILLVGHNPDLAQIVYDVTGARVSFKKGAVAGVDVGGRELLVLLRPRELSAIA